MVEFVDFLKWKFLRVLFQYPHCVLLKFFLARLDISLKQAVPDQFLSIVLIEPDYSELFRKLKVIRHKFIKAVLESAHFH